MAPTCLGCPYWEGLSAPVLGRRQARRWLKGAAQVSSDLTQGGTLN
jgi:hypothetical protein